MRQITERQSTLLKIYDAHQALDRIALADKVACKPGCAACCHMAVPATLEEAYIIQCTCEQLGLDLTQKWREQVDLWDKLKGDRHLYFGRMSPCPLLGDGSCNVYSERPLACRLFVSTDATECRPGGRPHVIRPTYDVQFVALVDMLHDGDTSSYLLGAAMLHVIGEIPRSNLQAYRMGHGS